MNPFEPESEAWPSVTQDDWLQLAGDSMVKLFQVARDAGEPPPVCGKVDGQSFLRLRETPHQWKIVARDRADSSYPASPPSVEASPSEQIGEALISWIENQADTIALRSPTDIFRSAAMFRAARILATGLVDEKAFPSSSLPSIRAVISGQLDDGEKESSAIPHPLVLSTIQSLGAILGMADELEFEEEAAAFRMEGAGSSAEVTEHRIAAMAEILRNESHIGSIGDPLAGSFFVEQLSRKFINEAWHALPEEFRAGVDFNRISTAEKFSAKYPPAFDSGWPGAAPFLRGPYPTMYLGKPWTIRQYAGFSGAEETNAFFKNALADGQKGLSVAFDLPTHRGYDSDHSRAYADVGKAGVAIDTVEDMKCLFDGIPLDKVSVSMTMNGAVLPVLAFFIVAAEESGVSSDTLSGTIQNDILKEYMVRNTYIYPPDPSMGIVAHIMAWLSTNSPKFNSISVSGYHMHEAGATAGQELAYTLANGIAYIEAGQDAGVDPDRLAARMSFFWAQGMDYMTEVAKLRAGRGLWARLLWEKGIRSPKALALRCHCQTSGWSLTRQDPINNIVRTTLEALSAVHGHTQSLHTNSLDEAVALPSDSAAQVARHTQLLIGEASGICKVVDPWGGSSEMESLTEELANEAISLIDEVRAAGGMVAAISRGIPQRNIEKSAASRQAQIDSGREKIVGVNHLNAGDSVALDVRKIDNQEIFQRQVGQLKSVREKRDPHRVSDALYALRQAAENRSGNLLEMAIVAARERATLGEISKELELVYGRYETGGQVTDGVYVNEMSSEDDDAEIDALRDRVRRFEKARGRRPRLLVAKMGQDGHDRGAKIVAGAFSDFGFDVDLAPLFRNPDEVVRLALDNDVHVVGISSLAGAHMTLVIKLLELLASSDAGHIKVIVGGIVPDSDQEELCSAGVAAIFGPGSRLPDCANEVLDVIETIGGS